MTPEEFYTEVARLLGTTHDFTPPPTPFRKLRWGPRTPGNGRFPGHGIVRFFGNAIHVALHTPRLNGHYPDAETALAAITAAVA